MRNYSHLNCMLSSRVNNTITGEWHQNTGDKHHAGDGDIAAGGEMIGRDGVFWRAPLT